jgi:hypothetical protein
MHELGFGVASIGGYIDPAHPHDPKRPPLPDVPMVQVVKEAVDALGTPDNLGAAQSWIPDPILEWLGDDGVIIYHHYLDRLYDQWAHVRDWMKGSSRRRVIWRSVGQSVEYNERQAWPFRAEGLERVAYSPKEANIPCYSGHDALIRFWVDPDEYSGWTGEAQAVINITQHLAQRHPYTNYEFWKQATMGLPSLAMGPGSEALDGAGELPFDDMKTALRIARAYLYTGTQPASYTLGLIEALMTGIPVVSIGRKWMNVFPYGPELFEPPPTMGIDASGQPTLEPGLVAADMAFDDPAEAGRALLDLLQYPDKAKTISDMQRAFAIATFGKSKIAEEWKAFLS